MIRGTIARRWARPEMTIMVPVVRMKPVIRRKKKMKKKRMTEMNVGFSQVRQAPGFAELR